MPVYALPVQGAYHKPIFLLLKEMVMFIFVGRYNIYAGAFELISEAYEGLLQELKQFQQQQQQQKQRSGEEEETVIVQPQYE